MATFKIEVVAGQNTFSHTKTITTAHLTRLADAYRILYGQILDGETLRDRTDAEVFAALAQGTFDGIKANVLRVERDSAANTASQGVSEIGMT